MPRCLPYAAAIFAQIWRAVCVKCAALPGDCRVFVTRTIRADLARGNAIDQAGRHPEHRMWGCKKAQPYDGPANSFRLLPGSPDMLAVSLMPYCRSRIYFRERGRNLHVLGYESN